MTTDASAIACLVLLFTCSVARAEDWPCFRGPSRQGISQEKGLPLEWSTTKGVRWKALIPGAGWSSPIVRGDRVFVTTAAEDGKSCRILCLSADTGRTLWDKEVLRQEPAGLNDRNSHATPTPSTDGERVYAVFGSGGFAAVDLEGNPVWVNRDFPFRSQHGLGTSPILWEGLLIMARDGSGEEGDPKAGWQTPWDRSFVLALDGKTGAQRWKTGRGLSRIAHVSPNIWMGPDGRAQVVSGAGDVVQGFDARTGERLWTSKNIGEGVVPSIVIGDGLVFAASGFGGRESTRAFRPGKGDLGETNVVWEQKKASPKIPSFLWLAPHLYTVTEGGIAACLKGDTGAIVWQGRLGGEHSASPVAAEGRIYFLSDGGETTVIAAEEAGLRFLARNPLGEKTQASMAVSGGRLFIRTAKNLYCIGG